MMSMVLALSHLASHVAYCILAFSLFNNLLLSGCRLTGACSQSKVITSPLMNGPSTAISIRARGDRCRKKDHCRLVRAQDWTFKWEITNTRPSCSFASCYLYSHHPHSFLPDVRFPILLTEHLINYIRLSILNDNIGSPEGFGIMFLRCSFARETIINWLQTPWYFISSTSEASVAAKL